MCIEICTIRINRRRVALALFYPGALLFRRCAPLLVHTVNLVIYVKGFDNMAKKLFVVKFNEEAEYVANAIDDFVASKLGMDTEAADYESPYDVNAVEVFDDEIEARKYFNIIKNVLIDMRYEFTATGNTIRISEPVREEYITFETIWVTSEKVPAWATMYDDSVKGC